MSVRSPSSARTRRPSWSRSIATKRPVILTQHGRSAAVLMDVEVYEGLLDEVALLARCAPGSRRCSGATWCLTTRSKRGCARGSPSEGRLDTSGGVDARRSGRRTLAAERPASAFPVGSMRVYGAGYGRSSVSLISVGVVPELQRPEIREVLMDPYRVSYHRDEQQVTILAVLHDRQLFELGGVDE